MRKQILIAAACMVTTLITACGSGANASATAQTTVEETTMASAAVVEQNQTAVVAATAQTTAAASATEAQTSATAASGSKILIAYFTRAENIGGVPSVDATSSASINMRDGEVAGNMLAMAEVIQEQTGGDLFSIQTERTYSQRYRQSTNEAREELNTNARPALTTHVEDMSQYDVIYLGFPNWWGTIPMAVSTFLEEYDFSGKTIIPFCSHEGSGFGSSLSAIRELCPDATLEDGYAVRGSRAAADGTENEIIDWLK